MNGNGPRRRTHGRFSGVPDIIAERGPVAGFHAMRDICFRQFDALAQTMPAYNVLKLAIEADRHALFNEVAVEKARVAGDQKLYEEFQRYLAGEVDVAPMSGGLPEPSAVPAAGVTVAQTDAADEEADDAEAPEDRR